MALLAQTRPDRGGFPTPTIDLAGLAPFLALLLGAILVLMLGLLRSRVVRTGLVPVLAAVSLLAAAGLAIVRWDDPTTLVAGALVLDPLTVLAICGVAVGGVATVALSWRAVAPRETSHGEYYALLLASATGMAVFAGANDLITFFVGLELLSIPLYVLCAAEMRRRRSLESGLKYLVVGSIGSATLLYGLALIYGAAGVTDFAGIADAVAARGLGADPLLLAGVALLLVGLAFKVSIAPMHQWTPDVYEGAPTPITTFMATATKVAAFVALLRILDVALVGASGAWSPVVAILATASILVGNVGALAQSSLKRILAYSSIAQAGYVLVGVAAGTRLGASATVLYLLGYVVMSIAAFAVVVARERETGDDDAATLDGLGERRPVQAIAFTVALLGLAGIPATVGFLAKLRLVQAAVDAGFAWLAVVLVVGSMISLAYYVPLILRMWGAAPERARGPRADEEARRAAVGARALPVLSGGAPDGPERGPGVSGPEDDGRATPGRSDGPDGTSEAGDEPARDEDDAADQPTSRGRDAPAGEEVRDRSAGEGADPGDASVGGSGRAGAGGRSDASAGGTRGDGARDDEARDAEAESDASASSGPGAADAEATDADAAARRGHAGSSPGAVPGAAGRGRREAGSGAGRSGGAVRATLDDPPGEHSGDVHDGPLLDVGVPTPPRGRAGREVVGLAAVAAVATVVLGVVIGPLMDAADVAGAVLESLF